MSYQRWGQQHRSWFTAASCTQTSNLRVAHDGKRVFIIHENTVINAALKSLIDHKKWVRKYDNHGPGSAGYDEGPLENGVGQQSDKDTVFSWARKDHSGGIVMGSVSQKITWSLSKEHYHFILVIFILGRSCSSRSEIVPRFKIMKKFFVWISEV